mgnify:CR=1 FL=1
MALTLSESAIIFEIIEVRTHMSKTIIHVGYPKTATTTLQSNVFIPLHRSGELSYLGNETNAADGNLHADSNFVLRILLGAPFNNRLAMNTCVPSSMLSHYREQKLDPVVKLASVKGSLAGFLSQEVVNVISFEQLTKPYRGALKWTDYPARLSQVFSKAAQDVQVIVTIRRQDQLMESFWQEKGAGYYMKSSYKTPSRFYFLNAPGHQLRNEEHVGIFNFHKTITAYANEFRAENVHVLFFEDLLHSPEQYFSTWCDLLKLDYARMMEMFVGNGARRLSQKDDGQIYLNLGIARLLWPEIRWFPLKVVRTLLKRFSRRVSVPRFTADERNAIFDRFRDSNLRMANDFNVNSASMKRYGYV